MAQLVVECKHCEALVQANTVGSYELHIAGEPFPEWVSLLRCVKCFRPILVTQSILEEDTMGRALDSPVRIYPQSARTLGIAVPNELRKIFREAAQCLSAKAFTAAVLMCRKLLDGLCTIHAIPPGNLAKRLEALKTKGVIDERLLEWATELRMAGNAAAHDIATVDNRQDAQDVLDFTEAIADYVFTLRKKFEEFQTRRKAPAAPTKAAG